MHSNFARRAFTLVELLVVIAVIAILVVVVILVINPSQLLKQSRDASRVSDAATLKSAIGIYAEDVGGNMGSSSVVYVSIPDPSATSSAGDQCQGLGLPAAASDTYQCASSSTYRLTNGTGWIPINFGKISFNTPINSLPVDPVNTSSSGEFYTYIASGTLYETTMALESNKYNVTEASDGGQYADLYEQGTSFALAPIDFYASSTGTITYPVVYYNGSISASGTTTSTITFSGYAGEVINYALTSIPNGFCNTIKMGILNPDGSTLKVATLCTNNAAFDNVVLPTTGTYTAYLTPMSNNPSGTATITQNVTGGALAFNSITGISSAYPGQGFNYTFSGTSGEVINFAATSLSNGYCNTLTFGILNPNGSSLSSSTLCTNNTSINNLTLPTTGTYTGYLLQTSGVAGTLSGNLTLTQPITASLAFATPTTESSTYPGQGFNLTFSGTSGEVISETLTSLPNGFCHTLNFGILNPDGSTLSNSNLCANSASIASTTLSQNGTYTTYLTPVSAGQVNLSGIFTISHN